MNIFTLDVVSTPVIIGFGAVLVVALSLVAALVGLAVFLIIRSARKRNKK